ncbi:hypothetical protein ACFLY2_03045 [Patescibacteria group bacterium]
MNRLAKFCILILFSSWTALSAGIFVNAKPLNNSTDNLVGTYFLSTSVNEVVPMNNSPDYNPAIKAVVSNASFADKKSITIPQLMETTVIVSGGNIDAKHMISGCKNHGDLYAIA